MEVAKLSLPNIFCFAFLETAATLLGCYLLAVACGHVQPWLPMISDCGVYAPEKYPFRLGVVLGCSLMAGEMVLVYFARKPYSKSSASLALSSVASLSLAFAAVVSEKEDSTLHGAAAGAFFVLYEANMVLLTWGLPQEDSIQAPAIFWSRLLREICTVGNGLGLLAFAFMSTDRDKYRLYIALVEWTGTFLCLVFNWSFAVDLRTYYMYVAESTTGLHGIKHEQTTVRTTQRQ